MKYIFTIVIMFCALTATAENAPPSDGGKALATATFAGGCFWSMTAAFDKEEGVTKVMAGYTGGTGENPTYGDYEEKGHIEAVEVIFDPSRVSYEKLLDTFWHHVNPTDSGGQFCDRGPQYRPVIFYHNEEQKIAAEKSKAELNNARRYKQPITVEILSASVFYPAEEYHQGYYKKNSVQYNLYRIGCGRDWYLEKVWGKQSH